MKTGLIFRVFRKTYSLLSRIPLFPVRLQPECNPLSGICGQLSGYTIILKILRGA